MHFKAQPFKLHVCKTHGGKFRFQRFFSITKPKVTYSNVLNILKHSDHIVSYSIFMANNCKIYAFMLKKKDPNASFYLFTDNRRQKCFVEAYSNQPNSSLF